MTSGLLPQRAGLLGLNSGETAAAAPRCTPAINAATIVLVSKAKFLQRPNPFFYLDIFYPFKAGTLV